MTRTSLETPVCEMPAIRATVVVPVRNRETFIGPLLDSLFAQWQPGLELLVIDDASEDTTFARVADALERRPDVDAVLMRVGLVQGMRLISMVQQVARGQIIIQADSDDISFPDRFAHILACFEEAEDCRLVTSNAVLLSPEGLCCGLLDFQLPDAVLRDPLEVGLAAADPRRLGATMAYHRHVYDMFPAIDPELCPYGLDLVLPLRAVLIGSHHYLAKPLVGWRQHPANTHREAGLHAISPCARERYQAFELMALAQNIRDVESICPSRPAGGLDALLRGLRDRFSAEFDRWCRLRTLAAQDAGAEAAGTRAAPFMPTIMPILSLRAGDLLRFCNDDVRSRLVACCAGFHEPEAWGMWTQRAAQFNVRIDVGMASRFRLDFTLRVPATKPGERIAISVDGRSWAESVARDELHMTMSVFCEATKAVPIVSVAVLASDAMVPKDAGISPDDRLIGIGLVSLAVFAVDPGQ